MLRIIQELENVIDHTSHEKTHVNCLVCDEMDPENEFIRKLTVQEWMLIKNLNTLSKSVGLHASTMLTLWQMIEDYAKSKCDKNEK